MFWNILMGPKCADCVHVQSINVFVEYKNHPHNQNKSHTSKDYIFFTTVVFFQYYILIPSVHSSTLKGSSGHCGTVGSPAASAKEGNKSTNSVNCSVTTPEKTK